METPRPTGVHRFVRVTGHFMPAYVSNGQPVTIRVPVVPETIILIFSNVEKLHEAMRMLRHPAPDYKVQQIENGNDFLASIFEENKNVIVWMDLHTAEDGKDRWTQIDRRLWMQRPHQLN